METKVKLIWLSQMYISKCSKDSNSKLLHSHLILEISHSASAVFLHNFRKVLSVPTAVPIQVNLQAKK